MLLVDDISVTDFAVMTTARHRNVDSAMCEPNCNACDMLSAGRSLVATSAVISDMFILLLYIVSTDFCLSRLF